MSTVVVGTIPTDEFALSDTFEELPELGVEAERAVDHGDNVVLPLLWTTGARVTEIARLLRTDSSTREASLLAHVDDNQLFRVHWSDEVLDALDFILNDEGTLLSVSADASCWRFKVLYPNRSEAAMTNGHGCDFRIDRVGQLETESAIRYGLTDKQLEALRTGWREGYFDVPREIGIEELSESLGITHQAASERIRRGQSSLIREAFGLQNR